jgi:Skp family chaperone for outer membrane proteins
MAEEEVNVVIEGEEIDLTAVYDEIEAEFKTIVANLDGALKGLKALAKTVKKETTDIVITKGKGRGKKLGQVLAEAAGPGFGQAVLDQLTE